MVLQCQQQAAPFADTQLFQQLSAQLGNGINPVQWGCGAVDAVQPGLKVCRIGQGRDQQVFILALGFFVTERYGGRERRTEKVLADFAGDQRLPVAALQKRDRFECMSFLCNIGEQGIMAFWRIPQVVGKTTETGLVAFKNPLGQQLALPPGVSRETMRVEIEEAAILHVLILLMMS